MKPLYQTLLSAATLAVCSSLFLYSKAFYDMPIDIQFVSLGIIGMLMVLLIYILSFNVYFLITRKMRWEK